MQIAGESVPWSWEIRADHSGLLPLQPFFSVCQTPLLLRSLLKAFSISWLTSCPYLEWSTHIARMILLPHAVSLAWIPFTEASHGRETAPGSPPFGLLLLVKKSWWAKTHEGMMAYVNQWITQHGEELLESDIGNFLFGPGEHVTWIGWTTIVWMGFLWWMTCVSMQ